MATGTFMPGYGPNFLANLPSVPQNSVTTGNNKNLLETLNSINVPNMVHLPVPGNHDGTGK